MLYKTTLFLANKPGKPPFIGVSYPAESEEFARLKHYELAGSSDVTLHVMLKENVVDLHLLPEGHYHIRGFSDVAYDAGKLHEWLKASIFAKSVNFGVVMEKDGEHEPVYATGNKPFYFSLKRVYVFKEHAGVVKIID